MTQPKPSSLKQRLARIVPYFRESRRGFFAAMVAAVVGAATEPMIPGLMQPLLDRGFTSSGSAIPLWLVPVVVLGLFTTRGVAGFVTDYGLSWAANRGVQSMREALFAHLLRASPELFTRHSASSLTNALVYEVQHGAQLLMGSAMTLVRDALTLAALVGYLLWLNWKLTLFVSILGPVIGIVMRVVSRRLRKLAHDWQNATDELAYVVEENVAAWRIVRLHGAQAPQRQRFSQLNDRLRHLMLKGVVASSTMSPVTQFFAACAVSAVIMLALWQGGSGGVTVGSFVSFITAMLMLLAPLKRLSDVASPITRGLVALERGLDMVIATATERGGTHTTERARGEIALHDVSLRFREEGPAALDRVDLRVRAGETVALVGPSGAGKTTLVNLLPRFLEPSDGQVLLDGVPLPSWDMTALRRQFALVSQDVVLFNDTVAANVALGAHEGGIDRERVSAALEAAYLTDFVHTLPRGMDSVIGHNGRELSGGQRQRLAIARALYKDAPVLILDEATSALDSASERAVQAALETLMRGRTTLVIAHRLSTIEGADRVVAMEAGRIVESGAPAELLARGGLYAKLHAMQFGGAGAGAAQATAD